MINGSILLIFQQVESDFALNAWQYIMVTWARENGLALYINGTEVTRARGYMPQEGEHDKDSYTRLIVGRNAAGTPYGYTRMVASSLAFFDAEVPAESAKDMFLYFSSNGKSLGTLLSFFFFLATYESFTIGKYSMKVQISNEIICRQDFFCR